MGAMVCGAAEIRASWGRQLLPALPDFGPGRPRSRLADTRCTPIITEHFATIGGGSGQGAFQLTLLWRVQLVGRAATRRVHGGAWSRHAPWYARQGIIDAVGAIPAKEGTVG